MSVGDPIPANHPAWRYIARKFTPAQKRLLLGLADECRERGATTAQLAPMYGLIYVAWDTIADPPGDVRAKVENFGRSIANE